MAEILTSVASAAADRRSPGKSQILDKQFEVIRELGAGASARTLLVKDTNLNEFFAAKIYFQRSTLIERGEAIQEFKILWNHPHPNMPRPLQPPSFDRQISVLLEWIDGPTLRNAMDLYLHDQIRWIALAHDLCNALGHLERHGILHRDVKPENIVIRETDGRAFLIDYGGSTTSSQPGAPTGTYRYLPPEWAVATQHPPTCDRYAVAVTLYEALVGGLPFSDSSAFDRTPRDAPPSDLPQELHALANALLQAIALDPEARPQTIEELRTSLDNAMMSSIAATAHDSNSKPDGMESTEPKINEWVTSLRGLYRNSTAGNSDNRGLDSTFSQQTYIPTALDTQLAPAVRGISHLWSF
jgi:serine/threonine protein kinase